MVQVRLIATTLLCFFFNIFLTVHFRIILVCDQLDAQFFFSIICLFESSTCFEQLCTDPQEDSCINPLNPELNPICYLLALLGAHHFLHVSRIRVKLLTFRRLMSYIYIYIWSTHS